MLWTIRRKGSRDRKPFSVEECSSILDYLNRIDASKFALDEREVVPTVMFSALAEKASSGNTEYKCPKDFQVYSASPAYMPMAWNGMEDEWEKMTQWYFDLPKNHKVL